MYNVNQSFIMGDFNNENPSLSMSKRSMYRFNRNNNNNQISQFDNNVKTIVYTYIIIRLFKSNVIIIKSQ